MSIFVDTSALYAFLDKPDQNHLRSMHQLDELLSHAEDLVSTNYVLVETISLLQRRIGLSAVNDFIDAVSPTLRIIWIDEHDHRASVNALRTANNRQLSLVDCTSFETMRRLGIRTVFAFDVHFAEQGFQCIPA